jgi:hypothetical protein
MDFKKLIIVNLACLIITGKVLLYIFSRTQKNIIYIDINLFPQLVELNKFAQLKDNDEKCFLELNVNSRNLIREINHFLDSVDDFLRNSSPRILYFMKYIGEYKKLQVTFEKYFISISRNNDIFFEIRNRKLKIFFLVILLVVLINIIITRKFIFSNFFAIKEKLKKTIKKIENLNTILNEKEIIST